MKLSKKDRKLLIELLHCDIFAREQVANVTYDQERMDRVKKLKIKLQTEK